MDYERIIKSASVKLLRANNSLLIVNFLYQTFKVPNKITITDSELTQKLAEYLELRNDTEKIVDYHAKAKEYLEEWCHEEYRYLRKYEDENGEYLLELTAEIEKVFQWLESLDKREFIGTESRFKDIVNKLKELIEHSTQDPQKRIAELEQKKVAIDEQIREIQRSGFVRTYDTTQITERFREITKASRDLLSDFKEVEQNFREITRRIYEKQAAEEMNKGTLLGYALDATDELKKSDQGRSFYAFYQYLMADSKKDELKHLIEQVYQLLHAKKINISDLFLKKIKFYLHGAGKKVIDSNHLLAEKLNRILAEKNALERKKAKELIRDIKHYALQLVDMPPKAEPFSTIEGDPMLEFSMERPMKEQRAEINAFRLYPIELADKTTVNFDSLFTQFEINKEELQTQLEHVLQTKAQVTLLEVLACYPVKNGLAEILTYFSIASLSPKHFINKDKYERIALPSNGTIKYLDAPQIIFTK